LSVYSKLLGRVVLSGAGSATVFTAAAAGTTVIRDVSITYSSSCTEVFLSVAGVVTFVDFRNVAAVDGTFHEECRVVLAPGDVVSFATSGGPGQCYVSGYLLV